MYRLQTALGYSETYANVLYGVYGKVQTLYNLPGGVRDADDDQHCPGHCGHGRAEKV